MRKFQPRLPSSITMIVLITIMISIISYIVPNKGSYSYEYGGKIYSPAKAHKEGIAQKTLAKPIPQSFEFLPEYPQISINEIVTAPFRGVIAAMEIILFSLVLGAFLEILQTIGLFDKAISLLFKFFKNSKIMITLALAISFSLISTSMGFKDEMLIFLPITLYIMRLIDLPPIISLATLTFGVNVGVMSSITNPFTIGLSSHLTGFPINEGIILRVIIFFALLGGMILWFIKKIQTFSKNKDHQKKWENIDDCYLVCKEIPSFKNILLATIATFITIFIVIFLSTQETSMLEISSYFLIGVISIGILGGLKEKKLIASIYKGAGLTLPIGAIIGFTKGISIIMTTSLLKDTFLHQIELHSQYINPYFFIVVIFLIVCFLGSIISSTSGMITLIIPLLYPIANMINIPYPVLVSTVTCAIGLMTMINPIGPFIILGMEKTYLSYKEWFRFAKSFIIISFIISFLIIIINISV